MTAFSNTQETDVLTWTFTANAVTRPTGPYTVGVGTGSSDTGLTGEPSGNGYARQTVAFSVTGNEATNTALITFGPNTGTNWGTMTHFDVRDSGGTMRAHGPLTAGVAIAVGDSLTIAAGALDITLD